MAGLKEVDILMDEWKVRYDRNQPVQVGSLTLLQRLVKYLMPDLAYAFGNYSGGGMIGPPLSVQHMFADKVDMVPTRSASEGFENNFPDDELDSSLELISKRMKEILARMQGRPRMSAVRFLGYILGKLWRMTFSNIMVNVDGLDQCKDDLRRAAQSGQQVMLLPTHRSHYDYLLMSYVCFGFNLPIPHIASGDNLNIPIIGRLFAYSGAFFLRRSFRGDNLYKKVLYAYLLRKLREGSPVECFVEGGRTRTGMISEPKLGMLLMAVRFVRDKSVPDIVLLPSSIDYERTLETSSHVNQLLGGKKQAESLLGAIKAGFSLLSGATDYGQVFVNFGRGVSVRAVMQQVERNFSSKYQRGFNKENSINNNSSTPESSDSGDNFIDDDSNNNNNSNNNSGGSDDAKYQDEEDEDDAYMYIPEEVYVNAVAQAVVEEQRKASTVTPAGIVSLLLLGETESCDYEASFEWVNDLVLKANGRTKHYSEPEIKHHVERSKVILKPFMSNLGGVEDIDYNNATEFWRDIAKARLQLRYSCGQLIPILGPYAVVATTLHALSKTEFVKTTSVLRKATMVADMIKYALPGAKLSQDDLKLALQGLVEVGSLKSDWTSVAIANADQIGILRAAIAPSISACCACILTCGSMLSQGPVDKDRLIEQTRTLVFSQLKGDATDFIRQKQSNNNGFGRAIGFPEALSTIEIKAALNSLEDMGIICPPASLGSRSSSSPKNSSAISMVSFGSMKSFASCDERKSETNGSIGSQSVSPMDPKQGDLLCLTGHYSKGQILLEKIASLQQFLYRETAADSGKSQSNFWSQSTKRLRQAKKEAEAAEAISRKSQPVNKTNWAIALLVLSGLFMRFFKKHKPL